MLRSAVMVSRRDLWKGFLNLIYPLSCRLCHGPLTTLTEKEQICHTCQSNIRPHRPPFCRSCSRPLDNPKIPHCKTCQLSLPDYDEIISAVHYNDTMKKTLHLFKYGQKTGLRQYLGRLMEEFSQQYQYDLSRYELLIPIPLHTVRLRERGYNQAQLIAEVLSEQTGIPCCSDMLERVRFTKNQARLGRKDRWTNIQGSFRIRQSSRCRDKSLLLIDDLFTTGATASAAAKALKSAGAGRVGVWTAALAELVN